MSGSRRNPKEIYDIFETTEYFEEYLEKQTKILTELVQSKKMSKKVARKQLDMLLNTLDYLEVCKGMAKDEEFLGDNKFSAQFLYEDRTKM